MISTSVVGINLAPDGKHILFADIGLKDSNKLGVGQATLDGTHPSLIWIRHPAWESCAMGVGSQVSRRWLM